MLTCLDQVSALKNSRPADKRRRASSRSEASSAVQAGKLSCLTHLSRAPMAPISSFVSDLDQVAAQDMADWKVPGAALAVVQGGKLVLTRAYGQRDVEANLPVTPITQFLICSITKSFTATALALLHQEGRLDWSKPVRDILPEIGGSDPVATDRIMVLDLLCHRTGLARHDWVHVSRAI